MIKTLKRLGYLLLCVNLCANIHAMDIHPSEKENNGNQQVQFNLLNSLEYTNDFKLMILEPAGIANCVEVGHVSNLELVCKEWYSLINNIFTVIKNKDYYDASTPQNLKDKLFVKHLIINISIDVMLEKDPYNNYVQVIQLGLQNKPNLKTLTFGSPISADVLFGYHTGVNMNNNLVYKEGATDLHLTKENNPPVEFLKLAHLECFSKLEQFVSRDGIQGSNNHDVYFYRNFMTPEVLPHLKRFNNKIFS